MTDEFDGLGGSYVVDPKTGKRKLAHRTEEAVQEIILPEAQPEASVTLAPATNTDTKE
jgi:hypothetical protein